MGSSQISTEGVANLHLPPNGRTIPTAARTIPTAAFPAEVSLKETSSISCRHEEIACNASVTVPAVANSLLANSPCPMKSVLMQEERDRIMQYRLDDNCLEQKIVQLSNNSLDPETALQEMLRVLGEHFQVDDCTLAVTTGYAEHSKIIYWSRNHAPLDCSQHPGFILDDSALEILLSNPEPVVISNLQTHAQGAKAYPLTLACSLVPEVNAVLGITTQFRGCANGFIELTKSHSYSWTESEKELFQAVSAQIAMVIANFQLQQKINQQAQYQNLISQLTMTIRSSLDLDRILELATRGTTRLLAADRGLMLLLKYADPLLKGRSLRSSSRVKANIVCEWSRDRESKSQTEISNNGRPDCKPSPETVSDPILAISECYLCQQAFENSPHPLIISNWQDVAAAEGSTRTIAPIFAQEALPALLLIPLESQSTVLGFLVLQCSRARSWQKEELELMELISAQVSTAIIQTQTLRRVQALVDERTAQLQRSLEVQAKLYEKTRQQIDQLRHLNQLKDEFLSTMSHELRTPLTSMTLAMRMLRESGPLKAPQIKYLDILEKQCTQEIDLINDLLTLQQLESKQAPIHLQKIDLNTFIENLVAPFEQKWADKGLKLTVDLPERSLMLKTDPDSLNRIFLELLTNAGKYSDPDTTVSLKADRSCDSQSDRVVLTLVNLGAGISEDDLPSIFEKFRRGQGVTQQAVQGTGLGLALVKSLVQHLNGNIDVSSQTQQYNSTHETCFTLTLPQSLDSPSS